VLEEYDRALEQVAERAMRSVVEIEVTGYGTPEHDDGGSQVLERRKSLASGVIVDPEGYIVTNNHVVSGALRIRVILAPTTVELVPYHTSLARHQHLYDARLIGTNRYADLAVIKIEEKGLPAFTLSDEQFHVRLGQTVLAIGSPQGLDHTVTKGIVSSVGRQPSPDTPMVYVQTDAPINPGNSGGPLIDSAGNLVGINTFIYTSGGGSEGLGFAIPEPIVRYAYAEIKAHGIVQAITIGAHAQTITPDLAAGLKLPQDWGVILSDVQPGGPAEVAGLRMGDVVTSIDGVPIDSLPRYTAFIYIHPQDRPMAIQVSRGGKAITASITPQVAPPTISGLSDLINPNTDLIAPIGVFVITLNGPMMEGMSIRSKTGVVVAGLLNGQAAPEADLKPGDVIRSINSTPVTDAAHLRQDLATIKAGDPVVLEVERESVLQYVVFQME
jgi:serine protease Do